MHHSAYRFPTLIILAAAFWTACAARAPVPIELMSNPPCSLAAGVAWAGPKVPDHRAQLSDWCRSVGDVLIRTPHRPAVDVATSGLTVLTWNKQEDYGDLERLLRWFIDKWAVVVLVQEVARASDTVPPDVPATVRVPGYIGPRQPTNRDIVSIANELNLSLAYLPSMPNGRGTGEDRGCAILSTLPMSDIVGIEMPWESQRRVAVMATVTATNHGAPWWLRVVSMHLDNRLGRWRQAAAIADFLDDLSPELPIVIGGDLNAWFGVRDRAVRQIDRVIPRVRECGDEGTFRFFGLRLDHLFTTLPQAMRSRCVVEKDRFGSDHYPIVLYLFKAPG